MKPLSRAKLWLLISLTMVGGLATGGLLWWFYGLTPENKPKPIGRLIRELQKQDSALDKSWQALWPLLPEFFTGRFPNLEPKFAVFIRLGAAKDLIGRGPEARKAVPALMAVLDDPEPLTRLSALQALGELGPLAEAALFDLVRFFKNTNSLVLGPVPMQARGEALLAIGSVAPRDPKAVALLQEALRHPEPITLFPGLQTREFAVRGLERMAKANPQAVSILIRALAESGLGFETTPANALTRTKLQNREEEIALLEARRTHGERVQLSMSIIAALGRVGPVAPEVIPTLIAALQSEERRIRQSAVEALGRIGPAAAQAVPALRELLEALRPTKVASNGPAQRLATSPRGTWAPSTGPPMPPAPPPPGAFPATAEVMELWGFMPPAISTTELRRRVVDSLDKIGPAAREAVPALIAESADRTNPIRLDAAMARWSIDGEMEQLKPILVEGLSAAKVEDRRRACQFLSRLGIQALPELLHGVTNEDYGVRLAAIHALAAFGPAASTALPALERALGDPKYSVRHAARSALTNLQSRDSLLK